MVSSEKKQIGGGGVTYKSLQEVLKRSDIISIHLSLNNETDKIISKKLIDSIKPGTILINTAPMELIDLKALEARLKKGDITFIFDHSDEMATEDVKRFKEFKKCIIYPPIGFTTQEATVLKKEIFVSNVENFFKGKIINKVK